MKAALLLLSLGAGAQTVGVDPRLELDGLLTLARGETPPGFIAPDAAWARAFLAAKPVPGPSVPSSVPFSARAQVLMRLDADFRGLESVPDALVRSAGGRADVEAWLGSLRALAPSARPFLDAERAALAPAVAEFSARLSSGAFLAALEEYTGLPYPGTHRVHLSAFHSTGAVANVVGERPDGGVDVQSLFGPERAGPALRFWTTRVPGTLWHEQAHGALDALSELFAAELDPAAPADPCYGYWRQCVREHVVRAVMLRLMERRLGPASAAEQRIFERRGGFGLLRALEERLLDYEGARERYPSLVDFFPSALDVFGAAALSEREPFDPAREPALARARAARLARSARPKARDAALRRRLERVEALAAAKAVPAPAPGSSARARLDAGIAAYREGDRAKALRELDAAYALDPRDPEIALSRATALESAGRAEEALAAYAEAESAARGDGRVSPRLAADSALSAARLLLRLGRRDEGETTLRRALERAPADWPGRGEAERLRGGP